MNKTKIVIYGGAFDPFTEAHKQVVNYLLREGKFDQIWISPCFSHMYDKKMENPEHRFNMIKESFYDDINVGTNIFISKYEIDNKLKGATYDLLSNFLAQAGKENITDYSEFYFAVGLDNALNFEKWYRYKDLQKLIKFVVLPRKGYSLENKDYWFNNNGHIYLGENNNPIMDISSTKVRELLKSIKFSEEGHMSYESLPILEEVKKYLDINVLVYILKNKLYRE